MFTPPFILSIAGGGSTYTPGIVKSLMVRLQDFPLAEIRLYDIDEARQNTIAPVVEKVIRDHSQSIKFTVTNDPEVAFSGAHFVFAQMRVGQYKMREQDEKIPLRHGVVGQETCGPGGLAYGLRTILPMVELIDLVDRYAHEKAWIVNYSNPAAIVAEGVRRLRPNVRVLNICDMPVAAMRNMGAILGVDRHKLEVDYFGLNHFGWFTRVWVDGEDKLPELRKHIAKFGLLTEDAAKTDPQHSDPSWVKTWRNIKPIMDNFPEYLPNPYLQYYLMPNQIVEHQNPDYTRANEVMNGREKKLFAAAEEYKRTGILPDAFHVGVHGEFIVDVACSLAFNLRSRHLVMVENRGAITNLPYDAVVEVPAYITSDGPEPVRVGQVPLFHQTLLQQQLASEQLLVEATIEGSYEKALQAFTLNRTVPTMEHAKAILDEMVSEKTPTILFYGKEWRQPMSTSYFVAADWLIEHGDDPEVQIIDARMAPPGQEHRDVPGEYRAGHLPGAVFFDIEALSDHTSPLPHMLPRPEAFSVAMRELGISKDKHLVVYDEGNLFSAPRAWWMLKNFGVEKVSILAGGAGWLEARRTAAAAGGRDAAGGGF